MDRFAGDQPATPGAPAFGSAAADDAVLRCGSAGFQKWGDRPINEKRTHASST
jgi:hypothetical protein